jgi:hypothetical protein
MLDVNDKGWIIHLVFFQEPKRLWVKLWAHFMFSLSYSHVTIISLNFVMEFFVSIQLCDTINLCIVLVGKIGTNL